MKKVLVGMQSLNAMGFKKHLVALAIIAGLGLGTVDVAQAAMTRNVNPPSLKANAPHVYVVKKGDTLWDIAGKFLKKPWRWPEIWASNKHVKNPHWIYPGDRLLLCSFNGKPLIGKDEGDGCDGIIRRYAGRTNLRPQVRVESLNNAIPVIALNNIKPWLERSTIVAPESIEHTPYIVGAADKRLLAGKGQTVYARGNGLEVGQRYSVYREAEPYEFTTADGKKIHAGLELTQIASGIAVQADGDMTTIELTQSYNTEVRRGDRVLPEYDAMLPTLFYPVPAKAVADGGQIVRVMGSIGTAAARSTVTINRGSVDGAEAGQVFSIYQQGEKVQDPKTKQMIKLPNQRVGNLMIYKTFEHLSYAYILESELPISVGASIQPPLLDD